MRSKKEILVRRGFDIGEKDVATYFANYKGEWRIQTISKEEIVKEEDLYQLERKLFAKDTILPCSIDAMIGCDTFDAFALPVIPFTVSPSELDPYIARFVKAVNKIGVKTVMSCDGWHKNQDIGIRQVRLWMSDRYSVHWLWLITEFVFGEKWIPSKTDRYSMWKDIWQPDNHRDAEYPGTQCKMIIDMSRENEKKVYNRIQQYAEYLEQNREPLLRIREKWIREFTNGETMMKEADAMSFMEMHRKIQAIVEEDLLALKRN
ncbi:MAG: hypothetical protein IJ397_03865 [Lachnospiraceae bacterium]|nr:hypothetical protein [Lachnospiraceae bacterium]